MSGDELMRKYAEAHWCGELGLTKEMDSPVRPLPCVRDENGEVKGQTVKQLLQKINEELDELKATVFYSCDVYDPNCLPESCDEMIHARIAEEAADTITAITTMLEALGIDAEARNEAQRRVNGRNRERGRL